MALFWFMTAVFKAHLGSQVCFPLCEEVPVSAPEGSPLGLRRCSADVLPLWAPGHPAMASGDWGPWMRTCELCRFINLTLYKKFTPTFLFTPVSSLQAVRAEMMDFCYYRGGEGDIKAQRSCWGPGRASGWASGNGLWGSRPAQPPFLFIRA